MILLYKNIAIYLVMLGVMFGERYRPFKAITRSRADYFARVIKNFALFFTNGIMGFLLIVPITQYICGNFGREFAGNLLIMDLLIYDVMIYFWHRLNHKIPILWRFHRVHHSDNFFDASTAVRFHFGEVLLSCLFRIPIIIVFGLPFESIIIAETLLLMASFFQHANLAIPDKINRIISYFIVTPQWHFLHHHDKQADTDSHYANLLTIWDRIFKTRAASQRALPAMTIGLRHVADRNFVKLLVLPFAKK